ncbi:LysR family transcriptional regulator [Vibrio sp. DW001]|uniref:LysR family transcriptional regulator n=1 Tax=Vibrio sp. DW001 TaxID=2912315 RepID=UPI0023B19B39|nr:LysR family transcriptional regulator [Vibrio sp. DW001]WED29007.1 LysR family transcriptional regulator [Vibrio sp. DW001]
MKALHDFRIFIEAARLNNLSEAARNMDLTPAAVSACIKRLEADIGCSLFIRSTRRLRLTQQGELFLASCQQALTLIDDSYSQIQNGQSELSGLLQLSMPSDTGRNIILPWLDEFMQKHPKITMRIQLSDSFADLYSQPVDVALRFGHPKDSSVVALPIARKNFRILCASPEYIDTFGEPILPHQLKHHNCLCFSLDDALHTRWRLIKDGLEESVTVSGNLMTNDGDAVHRWARAGKGIAFKSIIDISEDLQSGHLVRLCQDWQGSPTPLNMICADRKQLNPTIQALREHLIAKCNGLFQALHY